MNVLVIAEDHQLDQFLLKPLVEAILRAADVRQARVRVCTNPRFRGDTQVLDWSPLSIAVRQHSGMTDLFLLCVDRDGNETRHLVLERLEAAARTELKADQGFFAVQAVQELEVWALAGIQPLPRGWRWAEVRSHRDPKEAYFRPHVEQRGLRTTPGAGRKTLGEEAASNYARVRRRCSEVRQLEERIRGWCITRGLAAQP